MQARNAAWLLTPAVVCLLSLAAAVGAQPRTCVTGTVTDRAGAALPGVTVMLLKDGEVVETVTTRADGSFSIPIVFAPGDEFALRLSVAGFTSEKVRLDPHRRVQLSADLLRVSALVEEIAEIEALPKPFPSLHPDVPRPKRESHAVVKVFYATDRARVPGQPLSYGPDRSIDGRLHLGRFDVSIPRDHRIGNVERPTILTLRREDPDRHFTIVRRAEHGYHQYYGELSSVVAGSARKEALVFVHGYNVPFESAIYRTAQIVYDLEFDGAPILYSWPSQGTVVDYPVDLNNSEWTVPHLRWFLEDVATKSGARIVHLVAHSMGNRALVNALYRIATEQRATPRPRFSQVILTAPDIDATTFVQLVQAITAAAEQITLYASSNDQALEASRTYQGYQRAGDSSPEVVVLPGVDTIDVSTVDTSLLGHSYYAENKSVLSDIYGLVREGKPPALRFGIRATGEPPRRYWAFNP